MIMGYLNLVLVYVKRLLGVISFFWPKIMIWVLDKLTSRLEEVQNSYSLFNNLCKPVLDIE